jgi:hypothetical protein
VLARVLPAPRPLVPTDPVRQARHGPVRSRFAVRRAGDADGGPAGGARRGRSLEGCRAGSARRVLDGRALRSHLSGAYEGAGTVPPLPTWPWHRRSRDAGRAERGPCGVGDAGVLRQVVGRRISDALRERGGPALDGQLDACGREPGRRLCAQPSLVRDRRDVLPACACRPSSSTGRAGKTWRWTWPRGSRPRT